MLMDILKWTGEALLAAAIFYGIFYLAMPEKAKYYAKVAVAKVKGLFSSSMK